MSKNKAFTLIETLLAMTIIGVISAAVALQLQKIEADQIKVSFGNCYSQLVSVIKEMYNDETIYPKIPTGKKTATGQPEFLGFCNGYTNGVLANPFTKFNKLFSENIAADDISTSGAYTYIDSRNNSYWYLSGFVLYKSDCNTVANAFIVIAFDVNGLSKGPNCPYTGKFKSGNTFNTVTTTNCKNPDTFWFKIKADGTIVYDTNKYYDGKDLETYLKDNHFLDSNK